MYQSYLGLKKSSDKSRGSEKPAELKRETASNPISTSFASDERNNGSGVKAVR